MKVRIRNFAGISRADLEGDRCLLVAGKNGAGKSSVLEAVSAAVTGRFDARSIAKKKDSDALVRDGATEAIVAIETANGSATMKWPGECEYVTAGKPPQGHPLAVGPRSILDLAADERARVLVDLLGAAPTKDDLAAALSDHKVRPQVIDRIWSMVEVDGWDAAQKEVDEGGVAFKQQWKSATGEQWGEKKATGWRPKGWEPLDDMPTTVDGLKDLIATLRIDVEKAVAAAAGSSEAIKELEAQCTDLEKVAYTHADHEEALEKAQAALEEAVTKRREIRDPTVDNSLPCPHEECGRPIVLVQVDRATTRLERGVAPGEIPEATLKKIRVKIAELDGETLRCRSEIDAANRGKLAAENADRDLKRITARLATLKQKAGAKPADLSALRQQLVDVEDYLKGFVAYSEATRVHTLILSNANIRAVMAPEGLRRQKLEDTLGSFNEALAGYAKTAGCLPVTLGPDLSARYGGRPYGLCSESEQWRVRSMLQFALAMGGHADVLVVPSFHLVEPKARPGFIKLFHSAQRPVVVEMMAQDASLVPDLAKAKMGASFWIEAGKSMPIGGAAEKEAA